MKKVVSKRVIRLGEEKSARSEFNVHDGRRLAVACQVFHFDELDLFEVDQAHETGNDARNVLVHHARHHVALCRLFFLCLVLYDARC